MNTDFLPLSFDGACSLVLHLSIVRASQRMDGVSDHARSSVYPSRPPQQGPYTDCEPIPRISTATGTLRWSARKPNK